MLTPVNLLSYALDWVSFINLMLWIGLGYLLPTLGIDHGVDPGVELAISCGQLAMVPLCVIFIEDGQGTEGLTESTPG